MANETLTVIGMGKLGLGMAACLADKEYRVIGVDTNRAVVDAINEGYSPLYEPGLKKLMVQVKGRLTATDDYKQAVDSSGIIFIFVGTPSEPDSSFSTKDVEAVTRSIAPHLKNRRDFPVVVLRSTVLPGVCDDVIKPLLEDISGRKCGKDFGLCHNPEILALGSVIHDFLNPDVVIIGESDAKSGEILSGIYQKTCENNPPVVRTTLHNAELAKVALNVFLTMKMSFANTLAEMCERIPGGDVDAVSRILGYNSAIGRKFLTGAIGYGGPCFPRDTRAFAAFAGKSSTQAKLIQAAEEVNEMQAGRVIEMTKRKLRSLKDKNIAVLGLTYKPNTDIVLESDSLKIAGALIQQGAGVAVYDPAGMENVRKALRQDNIRYAESAVDCLKDADLCILATPWEEFKALRPGDFVGNMKRPVLLDCWRMFNRPEFTDKLDYLAVGLNPTG